MYELLANDKTFPAFRIGNKWCINADKLNDWIDKQSDKRQRVGADLKVVKFDLKEAEDCLISLAYMYSNADARKDYKTLQQDIRIEYPSNELDIISSIITNYSDEEQPLFNIEVVKALTACNRYSDITGYACDSIS